MKDFTQFELIDILKIPWRRRWYFLAAMLIVLISVLGYALIRPNMYRSVTRIVVESSSLLEDPLVSRGVQDQTEERASYIRQMLQSRRVLERIVEEFRLRAADTSIPLEEAIYRIQRDLDVSKATNGAFTLSYTAPDPQVAQAITRRLAEILIQLNQSNVKSKAIDKDQFLEQELRQAELELSAVDDKIKQFKASHLGELPEQSAANLNALSGLRSQLVAIDSELERARNQRQTLEFRIQEQHRMIDLAKSISPESKQTDQFGVSRNSSSSPAHVLLANKRAQLAEANSKFTAKHPDVARLTREIEDLTKQLKESEAAQNSSQDALQTALGAKEIESGQENGRIRKIEISAESEIAQAKYELDLLAGTISRREKERENLQKNISAFQNRLNLTPALEQELNALMREHDTKQQQVASLGNRKFNAQVAANAAANQKNDVYNILDEASLPEKPISPTRLEIILIGIGISIAAGFGAAVAREYFESSLATEEETAAVLNLPVLASIPEISADSGL